MPVHTHAAHAVVFAPSDTPAAAGPFTISLKRVSLALASGRPLFDDLSTTFHAGRTGLVGANGAGKSVLARLLAGLAAPDSGSVARQGAVAYVPQELRPAPAATIAGVAGLAPLFSAMRRLAAGDACEDEDEGDGDLDLLDGRWHIPAAFEQALAACGLGRFQPDDPAAGLSGGELMRVALAGAFLSQADGLVLDEPTNHLDRAGRQWLRDQLAQWRGGAIVVSHDRELLDDMDRIAELDAAGLRSYSGNYSLYEARRDGQSAAALAALEHARAERNAALRELRKQHDAGQSRAARNARAGKEANMPAIARGRLKSNAESHAGREAQRQAESRAALDDAVREAAARVSAPAAVALMLPAATVAAGKRIVELEQAVPPYPAGASALDLHLAGPVRLAIVGPNGCGKTTLLRMLAGLQAPAAGSCRTLVPHAWLDQHAAALLPPQLTVLERLRQLETPLAEGVLRSHLALLGIQAAQAATPARGLSGGERLKAALACALWRREPAQLLLLDEPTNHLDLASVRALEQALQAYPGALAVVSHDVRFVAALDPSHSLAWHAGAWTLTRLGDGGRPGLRRC